MSYKVSVDSVVETDDVLGTFIDIVFRRNSVGSWSLFGAGVAIPLSVTIACWIDGRYLAAMIFSAAALVMVMCRLVGVSHEKPAEQIERPEELKVQT